VLTITSYSTSDNLFVESLSLPVPGRCKLGDFAVGLSAVPKSWLPQAPLAATLLLLHMTPSDSSRDVSGSQLLVTPTEVACLPGAIRDAVRLSEVADRQ